MISDLVVQHSITLAKALGLAPDKDLKKQLKAKTLEDIHKAVKEIVRSQSGFTLQAPCDYNLSCTKFLPRIDGDFLPSQLDELLKEAPPKPAIVGLAEKEGIVNSEERLPASSATLNRAQSIMPFGVPPEKIGDFGKENLIRFIRNVVSRREYFGSETEEVEKLLLQRVRPHVCTRNFQFVEKGPPNADHKFYLEAYVEVVSLDCP